MVLFSWIKYFIPFDLRRSDCRTEWYNFYDVLVDITWEIDEF